MKIIYTYEEMQAIGEQAYRAANKVTAGVDVEIVIQPKYLSEGLREQQFDTTQRIHPDMAKEA